MLAKKNRLSNPKNIKGDFFKSEFFDLKTYQGQNKEPKFAFVVSKKIEKSAVLRNGTKRILAEAIRVNLDKVRDGVEAVIIAKRILPNEQKGKTEQIILQEFKKANIIK